MKSRKICLCALFTVLLTIGAYIRVPTPLFPLTLQMQVCLLGAMLLGALLSLASTSVYLLMGLLGLPVFFAFSGFSFFTQPTAGYLLSFLLASFVVGLLSKKCDYSSLGSIYLCTLPGILIVELLGGIYLYLISTLYLCTSLDLSNFLLWGVLLATVKDLLLNIPLAILIKKLRPIPERM